MAQYNTFFIRHEDDGSEQDRLNLFIRTHRVIRVRNEVLPEGWAFCVEWLEGVPSAGAVGSQMARKKDKVDYMKVLPPEVFKKFSAMREVRKALAEKAGVAVFEVLNNDQLAEFVQQENRSLSALGKIHGVGEARVKRFGKELLEALLRIEQGEEDLTPSSPSPQSQEEGLS